MTSIPSAPAPTPQRALNFNAGPGTLPLPALQRAQEELLSLEGTGISVLEHSHRGPTYEAVHDEAIGLLRELLAIPDSHEVLFLQGGASMQFAQLPMNQLGPGRRAEYVVNGAWGEKAVAEARATASLLGGEVRVCATTGEAQVGSKELRYRRASSPGEATSEAGAAYVHFTSNETIHGIQYGHTAHRAFPSAAAPLVCDMSSDFLSRRVDIAPFSYVYAGAQKNVGPSGLVVALARRDFLDAGRSDLPTILQYRTHAKNRSLYNTPPTFSIYLVRNVLAWLKAEGGLPAMEARNRSKAELVYGVLDAHAGFYTAPVERESRSQMNVVFRLPEEQLEEAFLAAAEAEGMVGLRGHRSVGGLRVSLYNAVPVAWAQTLADFMAEFARTHG